MSEENNQALPGATPDKAPAQSVAGGSGGSPAVSASPQSSAVASVPKFGGLKGGRVRRDGLIPGSREAAEADRAKDRDRKRKARARKRAMDPAPLPSHAKSPAGPSGPAAGTPPPGNDAPFHPQTIGPIPWQEADLSPIFEQLLPTFEELSVNSLANKATEANMPPELVREIEKDAKWSAPAKKALNIGCPQLAAKYLNKSGISAENKPEVTVGIALTSIFASHTLLMKKLEKFIQDQQPKEEGEKPKQ